MNFNRHGILDYKDLGKALDEYKLNAISASHLHFGRYTEVALVNYLMGREIEDIAREMNVTTTRIVVMLAKVQRKLGIKPPSTPISEWVENSDAIDLKTKITSAVTEYVATGQYEKVPISSLVEDILEAFRTHVENTGVYHD